MSRPLVESAVARGRYVDVTTYHDGPRSPIRGQLLFRTPQEASACARALTAALYPEPAALPVADAGADR